MRDVFIVNCCRTAVGTFGGSLRDVPAAELGAVTVREALRRAGIAPEQVDEVLFGGVITAGLGQNIARQVAIKAGIPYQVTATAINMVCGSGYVLRFDFCKLPSYFVIIPQNINNLPGKLLRIFFTPFLAALVPGCCAVCCACAGHVC